LRDEVGGHAPLSAPTIARVNGQFREEFDVWKARRLDHEHYVYMWVDGVVRHEALWKPSGDERAPPTARRSASMKLRAARTWRQMERREQL
jgi:hypothetical protein